MLLLKLLDGVQPYVEMREVVIKILVEMALIKPQRPCCTKAPSHGWLKHHLYFRGPQTPKTSLSTPIFRRRLTLPCLYTDIIVIYPIHRVGMVGLSGLREGKKGFTMVVDKYMPSLNFEDLDMIARG